MAKRTVCCCYSGYRDKTPVLLITGTSILIMLFYLSVTLTTTSIKNYRVPPKAKKDGKMDIPQNPVHSLLDTDNATSLRKTGDGEKSISDEERFLERLMSSIIRNQKENIEDSLSYYKIHPAANVTSLNQLILSEGGKPIRNMVVTTWRSGSTFLGDLMQSHPATFYHYEPLLPYGITTIRGSPLSDVAIKDLRKLLNCDYYNFEHYIQFWEKNSFIFSHNKPLWKFCSRFPKLCSNPEFLSKFCSLFPFQIIKTVRLLVNLTEELLEDSSTKILLLVRDPRGTLQSRSHRDWCPENPDCSDTRRLCQDLVDDYHSAIEFSRKYPKSFKVIRYEDLSLNIYNKSRELFAFFHLSFNTRVKLFLNSHTKENIGGVSSTFRDSKTAPTHWRTKMKWTAVQYIQEICTDAMNLWGYKVSVDQDHLTEFNPIGEFKFPPL